MLCWVRHKPNDSTDHTSDFVHTFLPKTTVYSIKTALKKWCDVACSDTSVNNLWYIHIANYNCLHVNHFLTAKKWWRSYVLQQQPVGTKNHPTKSSPVLSMLYLFRCLKSWFIATLIHWKGNYKRDRFWCTKNSQLFSNAS